MNATADVLPLPLAPDFIARLETHLVRHLADVAEDWSECASQLTHWEDEHLLDNPTPQLLAQHKLTTERMLRFGQFLSVATAQLASPDKQLADMVAATQSMLRDKLRLWHGPRMSQEESDSLLRAVFDEP